MSQVFISYSKKDSDYAQTLAQSLRNQGFEVWIDNRIESGDDWWKSIMAALRSCEAFIVIMSKNSEGSNWVQREMTIADQLKKASFPLLLEGDANLISSDQWSIYVRTQYEDVRHGQMPSPAFFARLREQIDSSSLRVKEDVKAITGVMPAVSDSSGIGLDATGLPDIDWIYIPEGRFIFGDGSHEQSVSLPAYYIARYPVTYRQYQAFVDDGGYQNRAAWTNQGWLWKQAKQGTGLPDWNNPDWHIDENPVVFVTWFEAMAFCRWLGQKRDAVISLPTEKQWEKAARGLNGFLYPWGNQYISGMANINEAYHRDKQLDPATMRLARSVTDSQHRSPFGLRDVCGNTWEWSRTEGDVEVVNPHSEQAFRGGSWYFNQTISNNTFALRMLAEARRYEGGFRLVMEIG